MELGPNKMAPCAVRACGDPGGSSASTCGRENGVSYGRSMRQWGRHYPTSPRRLQSGIKLLLYFAKKIAGKTGGNKGKNNHFLLIAFVGKISKESEIRFNIDTDTTENFYIVNYKKTQEDIEEISGILKKHFLFYNLDEFQINEIIEGMFMCSTEAGEFVFMQNSMGHTFFLVKEGEIEILIGGQVKRVLGKRAYFGELA